jgi:hypothetical protein
MVEVGVRNESRRKQFAGTQIGGKTLDKNMRSAAQDAREREAWNNEHTQQDMMNWRS